MKNLYEYFERIAGMQPTDLDEQRMLDALVAGAEAALARVEVVSDNGTYTSRKDVGEALAIVRDELSADRVGALTLTVSSNTVIPAETMPPPAPELVAVADDDIPL